MDPLCHTLVGAALGEAGLKRSTPLAMPALVIGANLPDVDVAAHAWGRLAALEFRRGWTHGILALAVLPLVLVGLLLLWDRLVRRRQRSPEGAADPRALMLLAYAAVLTHPFLDYLNTYGMRWLMPFRDEWYYGDALFIIDPWIWGALGIGVYLTRRLSRHKAAQIAARPTRIALGLVVGYILLMGVSAVSSRRLVGGFLAEGPQVSVNRLMVAPIPGNPLSRDVLLSSNGQYHRARFRWLPRPRMERQVEQARWWVGSPATTVSTGESHPAAVAAAGTREGRTFLHWSRFPYFRIQEIDGGYRVRIVDARYEADWASLVLDVPGALRAPGARPNCRSSSFSPPPPLGSHSTARHFDGCAGARHRARPPRRRLRGERMAREAPCCQQRS